VLAAPVSPLHRSLARFEAVAASRLALAPDQVAAPEAPMAW
jgi:hypothetical protein